MPDDENQSGINHQSVAERKYAALKQAVEEAGYFAPEVIGNARGNHITCTSKYRKGFGYTGRILFVTEAEGTWYIATPHPYHYRVLDSSQAAQAVVDFLEGGQSLQELVLPISHTEYEQAMNPAEPDRG